MAESAAPVVQLSSVAGSQVWHKQTTPALHSAAPAALVVPLSSVADPSVWQMPTAVYTSVAAVRLISSVAEQAPTPLPCSDSLRLPSAADPKEPHQEWAEAFPLQPSPYVLPRFWLSPCSAPEVHPTPVQHQDHVLRQVQQPVQPPVQPPVGVLRAAEAQPLHSPRFALVAAEALDQALETHRLSLVTANLLSENLPRSASAAA